MYMITINSSVYTSGYNNIWKTIKIFKQIITKLKLNLVRFVIKSTKSEKIIFY
jgi:hypothetical protein